MTKHSKNPRPSHPQAGDPLIQGAVIRRRAEIFAMARNVCPVTALHLEIIHFFGLRISEVLELRPLVADRGSHLAVGGRNPRLVPVKTTDQRRVLDEAKKLAERTAGGLLYVKFRYQARRHFEYVLARIGLTRPGRPGR